MDPVVSHGAGVSAGIRVDAAVDGVPVTADAVPGPVERLIYKTIAVPIRTRLTNNRIFIFINRHR